MTTDPPLEDVVAECLESWRDLREAVGLRNRMSEEAWATYEAAQAAPLTRAMRKRVAEGRGDGRPPMPRVPRPFKAPCPSDHRRSGGGGGDDDDHFGAPSLPSDELLLLLRLLLLLLSEIFMSKRGHW